ncbi:carbohydrate-binding WSC [Cercophora scortea]|uniref:Carbohydrate-binding WSC n=1 Tax=Cercophora scortea TaxID=314031 RepID=A0AAE0M349_9PEZI|nr:carbohydrate-binding WSC [Cercophora scortea]
MTESNRGRTLGGQGYASDDMSLEKCEAECAGWPLWGVEFGRECYCGNAFTEGAEQVGDGECDKICAGDVTELCGAANRLMAYQRQ